MRSWETENFGSQKLPVNKLVKLTDGIYKSCEQINYFAEKNVTSLIKATSLEITRKHLNLQFRPGMNNLRVYCFLSPTQLSSVYEWERETVCVRECMSVGGLLYRKWFSLAFVLVRDLVNLLWDVFTLESISLRFQIFKWTKS